MHFVLHQTEVLNEMKKVLIISYFFPPVGGVGVQRVLKFVKYLPRFGWQPAVLSVRNPDFQTFDPKLLEEVPAQTRVMWTRTAEPSKAYNFFAAPFAKMKSSLKMRKPPDKTEVDVLPKQRLATQISHFLFIPDSRIGWLPFAIFCILGRIKKGEYDMILSTSPPFSTHLVGLAAKLILGKPWVMDLRDLWVLGPHIKAPTKFHLWISKYIEHKLLRFADKVITVSDPFRENLKKAYPDIVEHKFDVITNGYDAEDFGIGQAKQNEKFSIGHVGSMYRYSGRTPYYFLMALADLKKAIPNLEKVMEVLFIGLIDDENRELMNAMASRFSLRGVLHVRDFVSHEEAISWVRKFDVLLFLGVRAARDCHHTTGDASSGKLYEYLAAGKPVLALTEDGAVKSVIEKSGCGILVGYNDIERIKQEILICFNEYKQGHLKVEPNWDFITRFERKALTRQLADTLNELSEKKFGRR